MAELDLKWSKISNLGHLNSKISPCHSHFWIYKMRVVVPKPGFFPLICDSCLFSFLIWHNESFQICWEGPRVLGISGSKFTFGLVSKFLFSLTKILWTHYKSTSSFGFKVWLLIFPSMCMVMISTPVVRACLRGIFLS